jgi:hypothetical protein
MIDSAGAEPKVVAGGAATVRGRSIRPARWRQTGMVEAVVGVGALAGLSIAIPGQWGFLGLQPHPFWVVVIAIAVRYGSPSGYAAGILAAAAYAVLFITRPGMPHQLPTSGVELLTPFLLFAGGAIISELTRSSQRRIVAAERKLRNTSQALDDLYRTHLQLVEVKNELQKRVIGQPASVASLYDGSRRLRKLGRDDVGPALLELATDFLEAEECAYYTFKNGRLRLAATSDSGAGSSRERPPVRSARQGLIGEAVRKHRVATVRARLAAEGKTAIKRETVLMAGPLYWPDGNLAGVVVIEKIQLLKFTPTTERYFQLLLDWAGDAIERASIVVRQQPELVVASHNGHNSDKLLGALGDEFARAKRYGLPLTILVVPINGMRSIDVIQNSVRGLDSVVLHHEPDKVVLVLPATDTAAIAAVVARLNLSRFGSAAISPNMTGPDQLLAEAVAALSSEDSKEFQVLQPS